MLALSRHRLLLGLLVPLAVAAVAAQARAAGGGGGGGGDERSRPNREQAAFQKLEAGLEHRRKALEYEAKLAGAQAEKERAELEQRRKQEFESAVRDFESAVRRKKDFHEAYNELGFARRSLGDYEGALEAYDRALAIDPRYAQAIEYRGVAYLQLGRLDDAKGAYMQLFGPVRELADQLLVEMERWVKARKADPAGLDPEVIDAFATWVEERGEIAGQTARLSGAAPAATW
jgi:tetratricopeptide (TPR) repeat protein